MILQRILARKKQQIAAEKQHLSPSLLEERVSEVTYSPRGFEQALTANSDVAIIAEVKKASPSRGIIREDFDPVRIASDYVCHQVQAISVLTERHFFQGDDSYLQAIRGTSPVPILRKDFIIDPYQIYQARLLGADAVLLIVAALDDAHLVSLQRLAAKLSLQCLVEVHDREELARAVTAGATLVGINNRDLSTFATSLTTTAKLMAHRPPGIAVVSESGIANRADMRFVQDLGVDAVLVGECLMRATSIGEKLAELRGKAYDQG